MAHIRQKTATVQLVLNTQQNQFLLTPYILWKQGTVQLNVFLKGLSSSDTKVEDVNASMINHFKKQILRKLEVTTDSKRNTSITIKLHHEKSNDSNNNNNNWSGEFSILSTWVEGGTKTFQRSGSYCPSEEKCVYSLQISYKLTDGNICTAIFNSTDAFHC